jgi:hypothetical protein
LYASLAYFYVHGRVASTLWLMVLSGTLLCAFRLEAAMAQMPEADVYVGIENGIRYIEVP